MMKISSTDSAPTIYYFARAQHFVEIVAHCFKTHNGLARFDSQLRLQVKIVNKKSLLLVQKQNKKQKTKNEIVDVSNFQFSIH